MAATNWEDIKDIDVAHIYLKAVERCIFDSTVKTMDDMVAELYKYSLISTDMFHRYIGQISMDMLVYKDGNPEECANRIKAIQERVRKHDED